VSASAARNPKGPQLEIRLFGRFEILRDGDPIPEEAWRRRKTKTLLKVLLTKPGHVFTQDQLIEALFEGKRPKSAIKNLYGRVSQLRRALEPELTRGSDSRFVVRQGQGYRFAVSGEAWIDTQEFAAQLDIGERCQQNGRHTEAARAFEAAIRLYRGEYLEADRYEEWALVPREHWRELDLEVLVRLAEGYAHLGDLHRAAITCRAAFDLQPSREGVVRQLMTYHHAAGNRAEALRVYNVGRAALKSELDAAPSAETEALRRQVLLGDTPTERIARDKRRIAVLPMVSVGPDAEDEYFADGMTEELIYALSQVRELRVIAQTSTLAYKNSRKTVSQIGRELSVGTVVEGSVRKADHRVRILIQLVDAEDEEHLWSHRYDRPLEDALSIQDDIAHQVARALEVELVEAGTAVAERRGTEHLEAYTQYLKGRHYLKQEGGLANAVAAYEQALRIDPDYALVHAGLAEAHCLRAIWSADLDAFAQADEAARKALTLARELPEAHTALGLVTWLKDHDPERAEDHFREAIALAPGNAEARHWYGQLLEQLGRSREALVEVLKAHEVDPLSPQFNFTLGTMLILERRFDEAISRFEKALEIDPGFLGARIWLARTRQVAWDWEGSEQAYREAVDAAPGNPFVHQWLATILQSVGKSQEAQSELARAVELAEEPYSRTFNYNQGVGWYFLGQYDVALPYMRRAAEGFTQACWGLGWIYNELGEYEKALAALEEAEETLGGSFFYPRSFQSVWIDCNRGVAYARMGEEEKALQQLARMQEQQEPRSGALCIAILCFVLGQVDRGFKWLEKAVDQHNGMLMHIKNFPMLEPVRSDPRYREILQRIGLPL